MIQEAHDEASHELCKLALDTYSEVIEDKKRAGDYFKLGGYLEYQTDLKEIQNLYNTSSGLGMRVGSRGCIVLVHACFTHPVTRILEGFLIQKIIKTC